MNPFKKRIVIIVVAVIAALSVAGGITGIVSCLNKQSVTLEFVTNGGEEVSPAKVKVGEKYTLSKPQKDGLVFLGWYYDENFEKECGTEIVVEKGLTLYARYGAVVTFESRGGEAIEPKTYFEGEEIGNLPVPYKKGFSFGGWFYDGDYVKIVNKKDALNRNVTVYAKFLEANETLKKLKSIKKASLSPAFEIKATGILLHNENLSEYLSFSSSSGEEIALILRSRSSDVYVVEPVKKLDEGASYSAKTLYPDIKFLSAGGIDTESADEVTVTTAKKEKNIIQKRQSLHISAVNLAKWEENVYVYSDAGLDKEVTRIVARYDGVIKEGDVLTIGEGEQESDDDYICKVISAKKENMQYVVGTEVKKEDFYVLDTVMPNVDDVYLELDVYETKEAQLENVVKISSSALSESVENNEGVKMLQNAVRNAVEKSPTIKNYADTLSKEEKEALTSALAGFSFNKPKFDFNVKGNTIAFAIELGGEIAVKNFKVKVGVKISNSTSVEYAYTICKSKKITLNPLLWFYTNVKVDFSNDFSIEISAEAEFTDAKENITGVVDITDEVEYIMDVNKEGQNKFFDSVTGSPLWDGESELEYVDIFNLPLATIPLFVPVVSLQLDFNVVGSLGAKAGLYVEFSHHYVETATLTNGLTERGENGKPVMYNEFKFTRETTANEIDIAITLKGQVGFRCGLEAKLSLSVLQMNRVAAVYVSFRFGPYVELSGLVSFRYTYDAVNKTSNTHLYGGMYLDVGLFLNAKIGAKFLVYDVNTDIFDKKISLYAVGDRLIPLEFRYKTNSPDDPYVITGRYSGVNMRLIDMVYLDIVTGEKVIDKATVNRYGATFGYETEFYDVPDYQTENYQDFVTLGGGAATFVSKKYQLKSLKYAIKVKLQQKHGVYASNIERIFYMEYRNPAGRDLAKKDSLFLNDYYAGGGARVTETLYRLTFTEGEYVAPPEMSDRNLPVRQGYYLDKADLWEKYYPQFGNKTDENWDGTFPKVRFDDYSMTFYRLKWKKKDFSATFYYPIYKDADNISENRLITTVKMDYIPGLKAFIVYSDNKIEAPEIGGKKFDGFISSSGLVMRNDFFSAHPEQDWFKDYEIEEKYYQIIYVDTTSDLYKSNFAVIGGGAEFYASYSDEKVFTETYVLEAEGVERVKVEYKPFDYIGKSIRPAPPKKYEIGEKFKANGNDYVIKGYRDINADVSAENGGRYYEKDSMPDVDKNRIYYVLYEREGYDYLPVYYVKVYANDVYVGDFGVKQGEEIKFEQIKINFYDERVISTLAGYPVSTVKEVLESAEVKWDGVTLPERMSENDLKINLTANYKLKELTAKFVVNDQRQSFSAGITFDTDENGVKTHTVKGVTWTYGKTDENAYYSLPKLNDYFDKETREYNSFYGWKNEKGEEYPYMVRIAFTGSETYTPVFTPKTVLTTIAFMSYDDYGYEYYYKIISDDYFGKKLQEVIDAENITNPVREDAYGIYEYAFTDWGTDAATYEIGTEKETDGNVKTYLIFKARFTQTDKIHEVTFDAMAGTIRNGQKTIVVKGPYGTKIEDVKADDYTDEKGKFTFVCWTAVPYSLSDAVEASDLVIGAENVTYYAYYSLNPATITLTFKGKVETEPEDGTGNVYFNGDKTQTELKVSGLYGTSYYIKAIDFSVDTKSKTFKPDYLKWTADGKEYVSEFYNDGYMANVPFDFNAEVEIFFKPATVKIVNVTFLSDGPCYEKDGTKKEGVVCKGFMKGFKHFVNFHEPYGSEITVPYVDYYSEENFRFDRFEAVNSDDTFAGISVGAGETITAEYDLVFMAVYLHDTDIPVELTFRADEIRDNEQEDEIYGIKTFSDGSVEVKNYGKEGTAISFTETPSCQGLKFVGWTTDGETVVSKDKLSEINYSAKRTYYAVYEKDTLTYKVTLSSGDGKFSDEKTEKVVYLPFGKKTSSLEKPVSDYAGLVFSHYETEEGYPLSVIKGEVRLTARYAKPVSSYEDLKNINLAPDENYVLTADIFSGGRDYDYNTYADWTAIGSSERGFSGTLNGNGYVIEVLSKKTDKDSFGLIKRLSGTLYNVSLLCDFRITGSTDATELGALCGNVLSSGKIIDCSVMSAIDVSVKTSRNLSVSGAVGVNNGLIDGFMAASSGQIVVDGDNEISLGALCGKNYGTIRNADQSGRRGNLYVSLTRSQKFNIGAFVGLNGGLIENSLSQRPIAINLAQGDNLYVEKSIVYGDFVGVNDGKIVDSVVVSGKLEYSVDNLTLLKSGLHLMYDPYTEYPRFIAYSVGQDNQGITYTTEFVVYVDDDAVQTDTNEYERYTLSEFKTAHPSEADKLLRLFNAVKYGRFYSTNNGEILNCEEEVHVSTGNYSELATACDFDGVKWNYVEEWLFGNIMRYINEKHSSQTE